MKKNNVAIAGIGITKQAKSLDTNTIQICVEAVQRALEDAGMKWKKPMVRQVSKQERDWQLRFF